MHIESLGHGPDVILLHGWAMHGGIFHGFVERLAEHACVHVVDLPGHGHSRDLPLGDSVREISDRLIRLLPDAIWIGWSLGGLIAQQAAIDHPARVKGLGLIAASPSFVQRIGWPHAVPLSVFEQFASDLDRDWKKTVDRFLALEVQGDEFAMQCLRTLRSEVFARGEPDPEVLKTGLHWLEHTDLRERLGQIACPTMWIAGARDRLIDWRAMESAAHASRGQLRRIEHAGHAPFITHADETLAAISTLLREASG